MLTDEYNGEKAWLRWAVRGGMGLALSAIVAWSGYNTRLGHENARRLDMLEARQLSRVDVADIIGTSSPYVKDQQYIKTTLEEGKNTRQELLAAIRENTLAIQTLQIAVAELRSLIQRMQQDERRNN